MTLYRLLSPLFALAMTLWAISAVLRGREGWADFAERIRGPRSDGPSIWLHGASVGELAAARPVVQAILAARPTTRFLVTSTTLAGRRSVRDWGLSGVVCGLAPLDLAGISRRMLSRNDVRALIVMENELWPARLMACHRAGVPVVFLNARMSEKSARIWARMGRAAGRVLAPVALVAPQDPGTAARLAALGVNPAAILPAANLKSLYVADTALLPADLRGFARAATFLAAATHPGEEELVLQAYAIARAQKPDLRLIIAPRHADRGDAVAGLLTAAGLPFTRRSLGATPDAPVYLADTMGEMALWYRLAGVAFIGGSLVPKGGHTPYEPAAHDCPILHGPDTSNFTAAYQALGVAAAAVQVSNAGTLARAVNRHLDDRDMAARARAAIGGVDLGPVLDRLLAILPPT